MERYPALDEIAKANEEARAKAAIMRGSGETPQPDFGPNLSSIVALLDQLTAAREDLSGAWSMFRYGQGQEGTPASVTQQSDRLGNSVERLHEEISILRKIAEDIRERS